MNSEQPGQKASTDDPTAIARIKPHFSNLYSKCNEATALQAILSEPTPRRP